MGTLIGHRYLTGTKFFEIFLYLSASEDFRHAVSEVKLDKSQCRLRCFVKRDGLTRPDPLKRLGPVSPRAVGLRVLGWANFFGPD